MGTLSTFSLERAVDLTVAHWDHDKTLLPAQSCFWEASPGYQNSFLYERSNSQQAE